MFGSTRWNPFEEVFKAQRDVERMFDRFWNESPERGAISANSGFEVKATDDGWRIYIPLPGIDPKNVTLEAAGSTLTIRATEPADGKSGHEVRYEQSFTVPQFLEIDTLRASHRHGMLELTLPLKESVKPRRIEIAASVDRKQIAA